MAALTTDIAPEVQFIDPGNLPEDWDEDTPGGGESPDPASVAPNPDAPYGYNPKTGRPYRMSPEERAAQGAKLAEGRAAARAQARGRRPAGKAPGPVTRGPGRPPKVTGPNYRPAATTLLLIPATITAVLAKVTGSRAFLADSAAITMHTPNLADAAHDWAMDDQRIAAVLERVGKVAPVGAFLTAAGMLALQVAANHGIVPPARELGVVAVEDLIGGDDAPPTQAADVQP